jgi:hypothetical protein
MWHVSQWCTYHFTDCRAVRDTDRVANRSANCGAIYGAVCVSLRVTYCSADRDAHYITNGCAKHSANGGTVCVSLRVTYCSADRDANRVANKCTHCSTDARLLLWSSGPRTLRQC